MQCVIYPRPCRGNPGHRKLYKQQKRLLLSSQSRHLFLSGDNLSSIQRYSVPAGAGKPLRPLCALSFMLCSPVIVSLVHQLVHLLWVDHGRRDTQRPGVGHCWCWQLLRAILCVLSILYYISSPVSFWTWTCVCLCIFQLDNLLKAKGLCWHWGPFTVNLTPLRGQDRAFFFLFFFLT